MPTEKEKILVKKLSEGFVPKELAAEENKSVRTIEVRKEKLMYKHEARNVAHLVGIFFRNKWI